MIYLFFWKAPWKKLEGMSDRFRQERLLMLMAWPKVRKVMFEKISRSNRNKIALKSYSLYLLRVRREGDENISSVLLAARVGTWAAMASWWVAWKTHSVILNFKDLLGMFNSVFRSLPHFTRLKSTMLRVYFRLNIIALHLSSRPRTIYRSLTKLTRGKLCPPSRSTSRKMPRYVSVSV